MSFGLASYGFGLLAGVLSTLSPCVLPIIPILLGSANNTHRHAPLALAAGLSISYAVIGTALAFAGSALGTNTEVVRLGGAVVLGLLGLVLMSSFLQQRFASVTAGLGDAGNTLLDRMNLSGLSGQFIIGLVLGVVWSPCVGPTLGAAIVLASQGTNLIQVGLLMGVFGLGAALPIVVLAYLSRSALQKMRGKLMQAGKNGKLMLGGFMVLISALILSGLDKHLEVWLLNITPLWLTTLTTQF